MKKKVNYILICFFQYIQIISVYVKKYMYVLSEKGKDSGKKKFFALFDTKIPNSPFLFSPFFFPSFFLH